MTVRPIAIRLAKYAVVALVLLFVVRAMRAEFDKTSRAELSALTPNFWWVFAAGLCLAGMNTVQMLRYRSLLRAYGTAPTWRQMLAIAWIPPLGKYVPGSIWSLMGAIAMLRRFGIQVSIALGVVVMVDAFGEIMGLILSVPLLMRPPISDRVPGGAWSGPLLLTLGIACLAPPVMGRVVQLGLRVIKRPPLARMPTWGEYVVPVATAFAQYAFAGAALWAMTRAITPVPVSALPAFTMVASCAMAIGYLFFMTSGGLGPREWIFVHLLPALIPGAPAGTVAIVTIAMRLMQVLVEVVLAGVGALMLRRAAADAPLPDAVPVTP